MLGAALLGYGLSLWFPMKGDKPPRLTEKDGPMTDSYEPRQPREAAQRGVSDLTGTVLS
jgi:hypothetical protein